MIHSKCIDLGGINLPSIDLRTLNGLSGDLLKVAENMVRHIKDRSGMAFLTIHGKHLKKSETLRRGGAHIDGNYMNYEKDKPFKSFGSGNGWKLGQNGPYISTQDHIDSYENKKGGIILASTISSCCGFIGKFKGKPNRGGDCTHMNLKNRFNLLANRIYYGNNHFIHESLPISKDTHRTFFRVTLPISHVFED